MFTFKAYNSSNRKFNYDDIPRSAVLGTATDATSDTTKGPSDGSVTIVGLSKPNTNSLDLIK